MSRVEPDRFEKSRGAEIFLTDRRFIYARDIE